MSKRTKGKRRRQKLGKGGIPVRVNSIGATDIRWKRGEIVSESVEFEGKDGEKIQIGNVDRVQDFITRYWRQKALSDRQKKAGETFARDTESASIYVRSQLGKDPTGGDAVSVIRTLGGKAIFANSRCKKAETALIKASPIRTPMAYLSIVLWVATAGRSAQEWAIRNKLAPEEGIGVLRLALTALADHYGLEK